MPSIEITVSGSVTERTENEPRDCVVLKQKEVHFTEEIAEPSEVHRLAAKSDIARAEYLLPDKYRPIDGTTNDWGSRIRLNATDAEKLAEEYADGKSNWTVIGALTFWLQGFGAMRIRRALHTRLQKEGVEVNQVE